MPRPDDLLHVTQRGSNAVSLFERFFGRQVSAQYQLAMHAFNRAEFEAALDAFEAVLELATDNSDPLHSLSRFYAAESAHQTGVESLSQGDAARALQFFQRAERWNPSFPTLHYNTAVALTKLGSSEAARRHLVIALEQNSDHVEAKLLLALHVLLERDGAESETQALQTLQTLFDRAPESLQRLLTEHAAAFPELDAALRIGSSAPNP